MLKKILGLALVLAVPAQMALAEGDAGKGEKVFKKCKACHAVGDGAENKTGPVLNGVVGRTVGTGADFEYSSTLADMGAEGKTWTPEELDAFLAAPRDYANGTKMSFAGLRKETERADVIAYLSTFTE